MAKKKICQWKKKNYNLIQRENIDFSDSNVRHFSYFQQNVDIFFRKQD